MPPPGRRRLSMLSPLAQCLALLCLFVSTASAAGSVLGLDFGTLNIKAALVKPGIPLEIVLTKDSKRKETAAIAFKPSRDSQNNIVAELGTFPERAYGSDALALQGRMPGEVYPNLKTLLGLPWIGEEDTAVRTYRNRYPAVQIQQGETGSTVFKSSAFAEVEMPWSVEELLAIELANVRRNAEAMAGKGTSVEDAVITVPAFYTADERRAIETAASLAGLDVNALISDGLAVGMDYAKSRTFPEVTKGEKPEHHLVFDMGAGSTTATLLRFQAKSVKDVGRFNKTVQEVAVRGTGWDRQLGGDSLNQVVLDDFVHKLLTKPAMKSRAMTATDVKSNGRAMSRLWKEAERARQVLSANTEITSSFEELLPEIDFRVKLTRSDFEALTKDFAERVAGPIKDALSAADLTMDDIDSIILHGGAVRTPFVQKKLEEIAGGNAKLRSNVNADESAVFGAAFKGAGLSPSFKVKDIRNSDIAIYPIGMSFTDGEKDRRQVLFTATSPVGDGATTKQVTFKDKEDFAFYFYQQIGDVNRPVTKIQSQNLTASSKALKDKFGCEKDDTSTKITIRLNPQSGLPEVLSGMISCEVTGSAKGESLVDSAKDWLGFGKKKDQEALKDGEDDGPIEEVDAAPSSSVADAESTASASKGENATSSKVAEKSKKRTESISIAFVATPLGNPQPSPEDLKRMRDRLVAFDRSDQARFAREEALNVLEGYIYYVRDFLANADFENYSTSAHRSDIETLLDTTRSFMDSSKDLAKATEETFKQKLRDLKNLVEPIQARRKEDLARPEKVEALKSSLDQTSKLMDMIRDQVEVAKERKSKAKEFDSSSSISYSDKSSPSPSPIDELADLEEPDTTTEPEPPRYTAASDFDLYTDVDLAELSAAYDAAATWLEEKETAQEKLQSHEDPVLLVRDVEAKAESLSKIMRDLLYKKMKVPPKNSTKKTSKTKSTKKTKSTSKTAASAAMGEEGSEEEFFETSATTATPSASAKLKDEL